LALDHTILANKRTLLAYVGCFIGLIASIPILIIGIIEFIKIKKVLSSIVKLEEKKIAANNNDAHS